MFSYYGAKTQLVDHYPAPRGDKIIEPFAGSARYALKYFDKEVLLVDKSDVIIGIWRWLQQCQPADILKLPRMKYGEKIDAYSWDCEEQRNLMGFLMGYAVAYPRRTCTKKVLQRPNYLNYTLNRIAKSLFKVRHWEIRCDSYENVINQNATWFIDPPYKKGGEKYMKSSIHIDYDHLASWCRQRKGMVIVCEGEGGDWLDFKHLTHQKTAKRDSQEKVWVNEPSQFDNVQTKINFEI